ncbi:maltose ABC transporter substrate-binding protein [Paenibacillus sp. SC116]|uniref:sugar ABC transporter substrate-binding protein n=1 Tax=Paenibacillus sp. SC116 TaxID=2968986 RepID=UPI00215AC46C|nr:maltose ABC transporter substrate-binding protein [Paenibacillus sp. SC116]MCR8844868.1 maltose ABC transporter substrate-binding protein [Paenibacillus sp. SC116]
MKKKWVSLLLSAMMVFTLSACSLGGKASTPAPEQPATETTTGDTGELKPEEGASLLVWESKEARPFVEAINKEFTEKYGVPVKFEEVSGGDTANKLTTDGPAGIGADVLMFPHDNLGKAVTAGLVAPNDYFEEEARKNNSELSVNASSFDGILYGYPRSIETYLMFYNKKLLPDGAPKTMEEVIELSKTMNDPAKKQYTFMWEMGNFYFDFFWIASTGGYIFGQNDTDTADIGLNNEGAVSGLKFQQDFVKQVLPMKTSDVTFDIKKGLFTNGQLAMSVDGPWVIGDLKKSGMDFGAAPIPSIQGKPSKSFSGVKAWYVNSYTKYPNAAKLYAQFASSKEAQLKEFEMIGSVPANIDAAADQKVTSDPITTAILEQFKNSYLMPAIPEMSSVWSPMAAAFSDVLNKGKDPKQALDGSVKQITDAINQ